MTIRDLIRQDIDIDVYDDVCERLSIAFCGPQEMTDEGRKEFEDIMGYEVQINDHSYLDCPAAIICIDDPDEEVWKHKLGRACKFFYSAAGYCPEKDYVKWFGNI